MPKDDARTTDPSLLADTDRRGLLRYAIGVSAGIAALAVPSQRNTYAADVPDNFRAAIHITEEASFPYALSALQTIHDDYHKASGRLIIDGNAVNGLASQSTLDTLKTAHDDGADIVAASDALEINGIDPSTLPDFVSVGDPGLILVLEAQVKGYHYYKV